MRAWRFAPPSSSAASRAQARLRGGALAERAAEAALGDARTSPELRGNGGARNAGEDGAPSGELSGAVRSRQAVSAIDALMASGSAGVMTTPRASLYCPESAQSVTTPAYQS